jgi:hypothetical protein
VRDDKPSDLVDRGGGQDREGGEQCRRRSHPVKIDGVVA